MTTKPNAVSSLSDALRDAINASDLSRYEIAKQAELAESVLSLFMAGKRSMTLDTADKVAKVLGLVLTKGNQ